MSKLEWKKINFNGVTRHGIRIAATQLVIRTNLKGFYFIDDDLCDVGDMELELNTTNLDEAKTKAFARFQSFINEIKETIDKHCEAIRMDKIVDTKEVNPC